MAILEIKAIIPAKFNKTAFNKPFNEAIVETIDDAGSDFESTVRTFADKPVFKEEFDLGEDLKIGEVFTTDVNYSRLNNGTPPHIITPRVAKVLSFLPNSTPKTEPGVLGSQSGSRGGRRVFALKVNHPGFKARKFDVTVQKNQQPLFGARVNRAAEEGVEESGHEFK